MSDALLVFVCCVVVPSLALAVICWAVGAYCDLRDDQPAPVWDADRQRWTHTPAPADPDRQPGTNDYHLAVCRHLWHLPDHQPTDHTAEGDQ